jgi:hypothetical protein
MRDFARQDRQQRPLVPRRPAGRHIFLDRALESLPLFRLSDSADEPTILYTPPGGGAARAPPPGDRLPGTFDQDVYGEICRRYMDAGAADDGIVTFTLHSFLRSNGRRADGRTYEQLRSALNRLLRTSLESSGAYSCTSSARPVEGRFGVLSSVVIDRRRVADREQLRCFPPWPPGARRRPCHHLALIRANLARHTTQLVAAQYQALPPLPGGSIACSGRQAEDTVTWRLDLEAS